MLPTLGSVKDLGFRGSGFRFYGLELGGCSLGVLGMGSPAEVYSLIPFTAPVLSDL